MKRPVVFLSVIFLCMFLIPFLSLGAGMKKGAPAPNTSTQTDSSTSPVSSLAADISSEQSSLPSSSPPSDASTSSFKLLNETTGEILVVPDTEFICGTVAVEMPISFEPEALKAQAVAALTYYSRLRELQRAQPSAGLKGADFTLNQSGADIYLSKSQLQSRWGDSFGEYYSKLTNAVNSVKGQVLEENGELIVAAYHAISGGTTEKSVDVFGGDKSYLTAVPSPGDLLAPNYQTTAEFTADEFKAAAQAKWSNIELNGEPQTWVGQPDCTPSGMVKTIQIGSVSATGQEIRAAFSLRSADFDLLYTQDKFVFTVRGYGHGVGMSQYGAQYMAQQGSDYAQILSWFYPGTQLINK